MPEVQEVSISLEDLFDPHEWDFICQEMNNIRVDNLELSEDEIRLKAYYRWLSRGCPEGSSEEDWKWAQNS